MAEPETGAESRRSMAMGQGMSLESHPGATAVSRRAFAEKTSSKYARRSLRTVFIASIYLEGKAAARSRVNRSISVEAR